MPYGIIPLRGVLAERLDSLPTHSHLGLADLPARIGVSLDILRDNLFLGVGIGPDCFAAEYEKYTDGAVFGNSGNLLIQLACEAGIIALVVFLAIVLIRVVHKSVYTSYLKDSLLGTLSDFTSGILVALLAFGAFCYLFDGLTNLYMFWCIFGIGGAALRISKQEFDELSAYLSDGAAADSSSIDVVVRRG